MKTFKEFTADSIEEAQKIILDIDDKSNEYKARKLIDAYDLYTGAIDDYSQMKIANSKNKIILNDLKRLGVNSFTVKGFKGINSTTKEDLVIRT